MRQKQAPAPRHAQPRTLPAVYDPPEPTRASYNGRPPDLPGQPAPVADMYGDMSADNGQYIIPVISSQVNGPADVPAKPCLGMLSGKRLVPRPRRILNSFVQLTALHGHT